MAAELKFRPFRAVLASPAAYFTNLGVSFCRKEEKEMIF